MTRPIGESGAGRILVVDDDATIRLLARTTLVHAGYQVAEAADGATALDLFGTFTPEIVLLDILMPGMDGFQLFAAIRALPEGKDIPVIIMTGMEDSESIMVAYSIGATDFITKPVAWQTLAFKVHYVYRASQAYRDLRTNELRLSEAQRIGRMGSWEWMPAEDILKISDTCRLILKFPPGSTLFNLAALLAIVHPEDAKLLTREFDAAANKLEPIHTDFRIINNGQTERYLHIESVSSKASQDQSIRITGIIQDITERKKSEDQIRTLAYYDSLTGLPNRTFFKEHLARALTLARRHRWNLALLFIDLDNFKGVNDSLGHSMGDLLLQQIAERLLNCIRQTDAICRRGANQGANIARLGGDEFMVLLEGISTPDNAAVVAHRIIESALTPIRLDAHEIYISCSIGISIFPDDAKEMEELIKHSDVAMYASKELGKNTFQFYKAEMNAATLQRLMLESALRGAIERNEFVIHYQPQVDSATGCIFALEALLRWQRPEVGLVSPASFIPIAEASGIIIEIDKWVLNNVCCQLKQWQKEGVTPVRVAVNLSGRHFKRNRLTQLITQVLADTSVTPHLLEIELTEGVLMEQSSETVETLSSLHKIGVSVSIDDFGTGYSSLNYLKNFPLSTLKIDRSFVSGIGNSTKETAIIQAIIALANGLGLGLIAEGVETEEQVNFLIEHGCTKLQGFIFSGPLTSTEVSGFISGERRFRKFPPGPAARCMLPP